MSELRDFMFPLELHASGSPRSFIRSASAMMRRWTRSARSASRMGVRNRSSRASRWWMTCITFRTTQAIRRYLCGSFAPLASRNRSRTSSGSATGVGDAVAERAPQVLHRLGEDRAQPPLVARIGEVEQVQRRKAIDLLARLEVEPAPVDDGAAAQEQP